MIIPFKIQRLDLSQNDESQLKSFLEIQLNSHPEIKEAKSQNNLILVRPKFTFLNYKKFQFVSRFSLLFQSDNKSMVIKGKMNFFRFLMLPLNPIVVFFLVIAIIGNGSYEAPLFMFGFLSLNFPLVVLASVPRTKHMIESFVNDFIHKRRFTPP